MSRYLSLVCAYTLRDPRRTVLMAMSIAVALCLLTIMLAAYQTLFHRAGASPTEALRLITHHKVSITQPIPISYGQRIRRIPAVREVMVWQFFGGTYRDNRDFRNFFARFAIEPEKLLAMRSEIQLPSDAESAFKRQRTACIVGRKLAERFDWSVGERVTLVGDIFPVTLELTVAGIYTDADDSQSLFFHWDYLRELLRAANLGGDSVGVLQVQTESADDVTRVADAIDKEFENSPAPTETQTERAWQLGFISFLGNLKLFLACIAGALSFTVLLVAANTISMAVRERVRDMGIMKTLGFTRRALAGLIIAESTCISFAGGLAGLLLAAALCVVIRRSGTAFAALDLGVTPDISLVSLAAAAVLGILSSLPPAWSASRIPILDALRNTN